MQMATIIQEDLRQLGIVVHIAGIEFRSLLDRVMQTRQYDACILGLGGGDSDPNGEMNVWLSSGSTHLWNPKQKQPATSWEAEIDSLMKRQEVTLKYSDRKALFNRVQEIEAAQLPIISLVSADLLVAATKDVGNFRPSVLDHYTLWNAEYLFLRGPGPK
jgi:peptide/nickel transport system substrate-binding protein